LGKVLKPCLVLIGCLHVELICDKASELGIDHHDTRPVRSTELVTDHLFDACFAGRNFANAHDQHAQV
jgi:hypothetical protein